MDNPAAYAVRVLGPMIAFFTPFAVLYAWYRIDCWRGKA